MARLFLIRHALTEVTGRLLIGRLNGYPLSEKGRLQAAQLAERMAGVRLAAIYASPLERTWETAQALAATRNGPPISHNGIIEVDYGSWSGRSLASIQRLKAWQMVRISPSRVRFPGGESLTEMKARTVQACEELANRHGKSSVAMVTHADIIRAAVVHYLGSPFDLFTRMAVAPASVTVIDLPRIGPPRLIALNGNGDPTTWQ
jgi:probable phosphoglycerate mutase